jgi:hypothetical protein
MAVKKSFVEKMTTVRVRAREDVFKHIANTVEEGVLVQGEERLDSLGHVERRQVKVAVSAHAALAVPLVRDQAHDVVPQEVLVREQGVQRLGL